MNGEQSGRLDACPECGHSIDRHRGFVGCCAEVRTVGLEEVCRCALAPSSILAHATEPSDPDELLDALARGLMDLDTHRWGVSTGESMLPHYRRDAERFLLPRVTAADGGAS